MISTNDDARFAIALGIRSSSSPRLNRLLAGARDDGLDSEGRMAPPAPTVPADYASSLVPDPPENVTPVALGLLAAGAIQALGGVVALASNSTLRIIDLVPAWPAWIIAAVTVASGAFALLNHLRGGRNLVAAGAVLGLVTLAGSLMGVAEPTFSWISDGVVFRGRRDDPGRTAPERRHAQPGPLAQSFFGLAFCGLGSRRSDLLTSHFPDPRAGPR